MRNIQFNKNNLVDEVKTSEKPVVNLVRAVFSSDDSYWVQRLLSASLTLKTVCYDKDEKNIYSSSQILVLGSYITPNHRQPVLELNYIENFAANNFSIPFDRASFWKTTIELSGMHFNESESLSLTVMERSHIQKRIEDWTKRIDNLFKDINSWLKNKPNYSCKIGHTTLMHEDLMQTFEIPQQNVNTLDIFFNQKIILAFKPKGLWIIGANGRIDIISAKGSYMIVDLAEQLQSPQWNIYSADRKSKSFFTDEVFNQVLKTVTQ